MTSFADAVKAQYNNTPVRTTNGMKALPTTQSAVLDLFGVIGSARGKDVSKEFFAALAEDEDLTIRTLLWVRDIRAGSGERQTFRNLLVALEKNNPGLAGRIMDKIPELGRWDDLFVYSDPLNRNKAFNMVKQTLQNATKAQDTLSKLDDMTEQECQAILVQLS